MPEVESVATCFSFDVEHHAKARRISADLVSASFQQALPLQDACQLALLLQPTAHLASLTADLLDVYFELPRNPLQPVRS
jgi:hypothetical protein